MVATDAAVEDRAGRGAVAEVEGEEPAGQEAPLAQAVGQVRVAEAVEAVAAQPRVAEAGGEGVGGLHLGHRRVEGGVEARELREGGGERLERPDAGEVRGVVEGGEGDAGLDRGDGLGGEAGGRGEAGAAVDDAVGGGGEALGRVARRRAASASSIDSARRVVRRARTSRRPVRRARASPSPPISVTAPLSTSRSPGRTARP